jgi:hypothetical protein
MKYCYLFIVLLANLPLIGCSGGDRSLLIGSGTYIVPGEYLVISQPAIASIESDASVEMIGLTFTHDQDFEKYLGQNGWLPIKPITAMVMAKSKSEVSTVVIPIRDQISTNVNSQDIVEFTDNYRLFEENTNISWKAYPKLNTKLKGNRLFADWFADCIPLGGMKGVKRSRTALNIPTSCTVSVTVEDLVIVITTSESNLISGFEQISELVVKKLFSWRVNPIL